VETAIIVEAPEAASAIDHIRRAHTAAGAEGAPAHATLLIPFVDSEHLTPADIETAAAALARFPRFDASLTELRYFEGSPVVLYLAPVPADPFVDMTAALAAAFPAYPPYGGVHDATVPHVTVAVGERAELQLFERQVGPRLPISFQVSEAWLFQRGGDRRWQPRERLPLGHVRSA
jgi:2'-5' RNA ligase